MASTLSQPSPPAISFAEHLPPHPFPTPEPASICPAARLPAASRCLLTSVGPGDARRQASRRRTCATCARKSTSSASSTCVAPAPQRAPPRCSRGRIARVRAAKSGRARQRSSPPRANDRASSIRAGMLTAHEDLRPLPLFSPPPSSLSILPLFPLPCKSDRTTLKELTPSP